MLTYRKLKYRPWPVTVTLLSCDEETGVVTEATSDFVAHFKPFTEEELQAAKDEAKKQFPLPEGVSEDDLPMPIVLKRNAVLFNRLMCGWGPQVKDESGQPVAYSETVLQDMVTGPDGGRISIGIHAAIAQLRFGIAPEKNSETSPLPGPTAGEVVAETSSSPT